MDTTPTPINPNLTESEKRIMFEGGTEMPGTGKYEHEKSRGMYVCKNCGQVLFSSDAKFDSGSGWPSFDDPANKEHVRLIHDDSHGMSRTEVRCANCGAHLGHLFNDGPTQTGQRYCINSACLDLKRAE